MGRRRGFVLDQFWKRGGLKRFTRSTGRDDMPGIKKSRGRVGKKHHNDKRSDAYKRKNDPPKWYNKTKIQGELS
jgi:hypothetical protein